MIFTRWAETGRQLLTCHTSAGVDPLQRHHPELTSQLAIHCGKLFVARTHFSQLPGVEFQQITHPRDFIRRTRVLTGPAGGWKLRTIEASTVRSRFCRPPIGSCWCAHCGHRSSISSMNREVGASHQVNRSPRSSVNSGVGEWTLLAHVLTEDEIFVKSERFLQKRSAPILPRPRQLGSSRAA